MNATLEVSWGVMVMLGCPMRHQFEKLGLYVSHSISSTPSLTRATGNENATWNCSCGRTRDLGCLGGPMLQYLRYHTLWVKDIIGQVRTWWSNYEASRLFCVPTPPVFAYTLTSY